MQSRNVGGLKTDSSRHRVHSAGSYKSTKTALCLLIALLLVLSGSTPVFGANLTIPSAANDPAVDQLPPISLALSASQALVLEAGRARLLYDHNSKNVLDIPAAAKLMTALLAAEQLQADTMITISSDAADLDDQAVDWGLPVLVSGKKYSFEFLLLRLLFYDSDAAALALAEQVSGEESVFVEQMNARAQSLELLDTTFASSTGLPVAEQETGLDSAGSTTEWSARISLRDLARLFLIAQKNQQLAQAMQKSSEYQVLEGPQVVSMHHQLEPLWTMSDGRVAGVIFSDRKSATTLTFGQAGKINILTLVAGGRADQAINDTLALYDAMERTYEVATLVEAGEHFFGSQEKTLDGEAFGLIYLKSVTYVRPIGQDFLKSAVQYQSFGPFSRPILSNMVIGQAIFQLLDGTTIAVDVGPDRQILSSVSLIDRTLKQLQANPNLTILLLASLALLILVLAAKVFSGFIRLSRLALLLLLEIRSRR